MLRAGSANRSGMEPDLPRFPAPAPRVREVPPRGTPPGRLARSTTRMTRILLDKCIPQRPSDVSSRKRHLKNISSVKPVSDPVACALNLMALPLPPSPLLSCRVSELDPDPASPQPAVYPLVNAKILPSTAAICFLHTARRIYWHEPHAYDGFRHGNHRLLSRLRSPPKSPKCLKPPRTGSCFLL
jgi:hypothetical protein